MRESDFEAVARMRIERAQREQDCETLGLYLTENYPTAVQKRACEALAAISTESSVERLLDALFLGSLGDETKAVIISLLSETMSEKDFYAVASSYDLSSDKRTGRIYDVLGRCIRN